MKTKKRLIIFVILITIFSILSSIFDIKTYQNGNTIALKNIEALAYEETINQKYYEYVPKLEVSVPTIEYNI